PADRLRLQRRLPRARGIGVGHGPAERNPAGASTVGSPGRLEREEGTMRKLILGIALAVVAFATVGAMPASSDTAGNAKHFFWSRDQSTPTPDQLSTDIIYH